MVYENVIAPYAEPSRDKLLPDIPAQLKGREKPTLVISLDGTLIESQWSRQFGWRYIKRPGVDEFLAQLAPLYELVLWTDCLSTAETAIDRLDPRRCFRHRLYRDSTTYSGGLHRKDLGALNRDLDKVLIIDCDSQCYSFQPGARGRTPLQSIDHLLIATVHASCACPVSDSVLVRPPTQTTASLSPSTSPRMTQIRRMPS